jgi:hypothetical protein
MFCAISKNIYCPHQLEPECSLPPHTQWIQISQNLGPIDYNDRAAHSAQSDNCNRYYQRIRIEDGSAKSLCSRSSMVYASAQEEKAMVRYVSRNYQEAFFSLGGEQSQYPRESL